MKTSFKETLLQWTVVRTFASFVFLFSFYSTFAQLSVSFSKTDPICSGAPTGSVTAVPSGGVAPYQFAWSTGASTATVTGLQAGVYHLTLTDNGGNSLVDSVTLTDPPRIDATFMVSNCGNPFTITANVTGGQPPYSYRWSSGGTGPVETVTTSGYYCVTITDVNFCARLACVTVSGETLDLELSVTDILCYGDQTGRVASFPSGGTPPYQFRWSTEDTTQNLSNVPAGTYSLTLTDAAGCTLSASATVNEPPPLDLNIATTEIECAGANDGSLTAVASGGVAPYSYMWEDGSTAASRSDLTPGIYRVTATDANNCSVADSILITELSNLGIRVDGDGESCPGLDDGKAWVEAFDGVTPYQYRWVNAAGQVLGTSDTLFNLAPATYTVIVTDSLGCTAFGSVTIAPAPEFAITLTGTDPLCADSTGSASFTIDAGGNGGPYDIRWNTGQATTSISGLTPGTYRVTVTDRLGCTVVDSVTITAPPALNGFLAVTDLVCGVEGTGAVKATVTGGTAPYEYAWSSGGDTDSIGNLQTGDYFLTVTDANGCTLATETTVNSSGMNSCRIDILKFPSSPLARDGEAVVMPGPGGTPPFSYLWSKGQTDSVATNLDVALYTVTVTDAAGCEAICFIGSEELADNALVGDLVWFDDNLNGIQDAGEAGVEGIKIILSEVDTAGNITAVDTVLTDTLGGYQFVVRPDTLYKLTICLPDSLRLTNPDQGTDDALDSDFDREMFMTDTFRLEAGDVDFTFDAGVVPAPAALIQNACACLNNATNEDDGQFEESVVITSLPNDNWEIIARAGVFDPQGPEPPLSPTPLPVGTVFTADSTGVVSVAFRHVDGIGYSLTLTNGLDTFTLGQTCFYPTIELNPDPDSAIVLCVNDQPLSLDVQTSVPGELLITLNGQPVTEIDPTLLDTGRYELKIELFPDDPEECEAVLTREVLITTEGCPGKIGDLVWYDQNENGIQDAGEPGLPGVKVTLQRPDGGGFADVDMTLTDDNGMYMFMTDPGQYKLTFEQPEFYEPTQANAGADDELDSDIDPVTLMTAVFTLGDAEENFTFDAGFVQACINVTDPGEIAGDQMLCGPGIDPDPIISVREASGGEGELEYLWMKSTASPNFTSADVGPISNSNSPTYDPGPLFQTTYFWRCARRKGCEDWLEPDPVVIKVGDQVKAEIVGETAYCYNMMGTLSVETLTDDAEIRWELPAGMMSDNLTGRTVNFTFSNWGLYDVRVFVTENGCTGSGFVRVFASNNPSFCIGGDWNLDVRATDEQAIQINWRMVADPLAYTYHVERSRDSIFYERIATVTEPIRVMGGYRYFRYVDEAPAMGRNFYRLEVVNERGGKALSPAVMIMRYRGTEPFLLYPNPVQDELTLELTGDNPGGAVIELSTANGARLLRRELPAGQVMDRLQVANLPPGVYFIRVILDGGASEVLRLVKQEE